MREREANPLAKARKCIKEGKYAIKRHAKDRGLQRKITLPDILEIIRNGYHEKKKDEWRTEFQKWNYAIRGKSVDQRECRVAISFSEFGLLIITVIDLSEKNQ